MGEVWENVSVEEEEENEEEGEEGNEEEGEEENEEEGVRITPIVQNSPVKSESQISL